MKIIRLRALLAITLSLLLTIGIAGGIALSEAAPPLQGETLTLFKPLWWIGKVASDNENVAYQEVQRRLGVTLIIENPPNPIEAFNLMVAGDMLTDIIYTDWGGDSMYTGGLDKYVRDGVLLRLNDLAPTFAPDYINAIETLVNADEQKEFYTDEGNLVQFYAISPYEEYCYNGILYRKDWMDELGLDNPKTLAQMENVLIRFKEDKGASSPMLFPNTGIDWNGGAIMSAWNIGNSFFQRDGVVAYGPTEPAFKEYLALIADWYAKGLIDQDFATRDGEAYQRMLTTGESGVIMHSPDTVGAWMTDVSLMLGGHNPGLTEDQRIEYRLKTFQCRPPYAAAVTTACAKPEVALTFLNYGYTEEGSLLYNYGIEGETYEMIDGVPTFTDMMMNNPEYPVLDAILKFKHHIGPFIRYEHESNPAITLENMDTRKFFTEDSGTALNMPMVSMTAEEGEEYARIMAQVNTYRDTAVVNFIMGNKSLDEFDAYISDMERLGINDIIAIQQAAYDRYMSR